MSATQSIGKLARKLANGTDFAAWADEPPARGAAGTAWEKAVIELAEAGDTRFVEKLRKHVKAGVIRSERALAVLSAPKSDAAA